MARYEKLVSSIRLDRDRASQDRHPVDVVVYWGAPGTGKTRRVYELTPMVDLYQLNTSTRPIWWDGLLDQSTILMDDFAGQIPMPELLQLLDRYQYQLPIKGGFTWKKYKRVYITSNLNPRAWYPNATPEQQQALLRRISRIVHFKPLPEGKLHVPIEIEAEQDDQYIDTQAYPEPSEPNTPRPASAIDEDDEPSGPVIPESPPQPASTVTPPTEPAVFLNPEELRAKLKRKRNVSESDTEDES